MIHKVFHLINLTPSQVSYIIYLASVEDKKLIAILKKELDKKATFAHEHHCQRNHTKKQTGTVDSYFEE